VKDLELEAGQVWELCNEGVMVPSVLLKLHERAGGEWDCLSLQDGKVFSASMARWRGGKKCVFRGLVGKRIA